MPTYVYRCNVCEETMEVDQRITEDPLTDCPCGAKGSLKRVIQPTAVMFKGSGFYVNDTGKSSAPKEKVREGQCGDGGCPSCTTDAATE